MQAQRKKQLALDYGITPRVLRYYMNVHFYDELEKVGYTKQMRTIPPKVVIRFYELFGQPENSKII